MDNSIVKDDVNFIIKSLKNDVKAFEGKTVLITGSSGFLGNYFIAVFNELNHNVLKKPCKVIAVDNYITGSKEGIVEGAKFKNITFLKKDASKPLTINGPIDYILHAAGIASPVYYMKYPLETIEVSTQGTKNILELAKKKKVKSVIFFSSSEIYGDPHKDYIPTKETYKGNVSPIGPRACYDESKRLGETLCTIYHRLFNVPIKIIRPFNVYGPGMKPKDHRVLPRFLNCALSGESLPIHGNGLQTRTYSYVSDATVGFLKVLLKGKNGEAYNIGNDQNEINLVNLAKTIAKVHDGKVVIKKIPYPKTYPADEPNRRCPDITKAKKELGFKNTVNLEEGLKRTLLWYKSAFYNK